MDNYAIDSAAAQTAKNEYVRALLGKGVSTEVINPGYFGETLRVEAVPDWDGNIRVKWELQAGARHAEREYKIPLPIHSNAEKNYNQHDPYLNVFTGANEKENSAEIFTLPRYDLSLQNVIAELVRPINSQLCLIEPDRHADTIAFTKELKALYQEAGINLSDITKPEIAKRYNSYKLIESLRVDNKKSNEGMPLYVRASLLSSGATFDKMTKNKYGLTEKCLSFLIGLELHTPNPDKILQDIKRDIEDYEENKDKFKEANNPFAEFDLGPKLLTSKDIQLLIDNVKLHAEFQQLIEKNNSMRFQKAIDLQGLIKLIQ